MPLFSIIIPVYNTELFLDECLQSILCQNFSDREIILVDDASTDGSGKIVDRYDAQHDQITVLHHDRNLGVSKSRNDAIQLARGQYILFVDSDDLIIDGSLRGLANLIEDAPDRDLIIGRVISQHGEFSNSYMIDNLNLGNAFPDTYIDHLNRENYHPETCWHYVIKRRFLLEHELYFMEVKIAEDQEFVARLLCCFETYAIYDQDYYWYRERDHENSLKKSMDFEASLSLLKVADRLCDHVKSNTLSDTKQAFLQLRIKHALGLFSARLVMHGAEDVRRLSNAFAAFDRNLEMLVAGFHKVDMDAIIQSAGLESSLIEYKKFMVEDTLSAIENRDFDELYLYCTGLIGKATASILQKNGYQASAVLDDNETLDGQTMNGVEIHTSEKLLEKSADELARILIVVCNQKTMLFDKILDNLADIGIDNRQVVHKMF